MGYLINLLTLVCIYTTLTASMDLVLGCAGLFSFAHAALCGVGAYTAALMALHFGADFTGALAVAVLVTAAVSLVAALITVRLAGTYFILGTFCVANVISSVIENWIDVTNGTNGLYGIPTANLAGVTIGGGLPYLVFAFGAASLVLFVKRRLVSTPLGIALQAMREDEVVASVLGHPVTRLRISVFVLGGVATALSGSLLAFYLRFLDPTTFAFPQTIFIWAALFVGGSLSTVGTVVGPLILVLFPEALRFVGLSGGHVANVQQALYGLLLVLLMIFRPQGLCGSQTPS